MQIGGGAAKIVLKTDGKAAVLAQKAVPVLWGRHNRSAHRAAKPRKLIDLAI